MIPQHIHSSIQTIVVFSPKIKFCECVPMIKAQKLIWTRRMAMVDMVKYVFIYPFTVSSGTSGSRL